MISTVLVLDEKEKIALSTGYSTVPNPEATTLSDCKTNFVRDTCLLEAGIGEYDVHIQANEIIMTSLGSPRFVAISNNTNVDYSVHGTTGAHPSTLAGIVFEMTNRWVCLQST